MSQRNELLSTYLIVPNPNTHVSKGHKSRIKEGHDSQKDEEDAYVSFAGWQKSCRGLVSRIQRVVRCEIVHREIVRVQIARID